MLSINFTETKQAIGVLFKEIQLYTIILFLTGFEANTKNYQFVKEDLAFLCENSF